MKSFESILALYAPPTKKNVDTMLRNVEKMNKGLAEDGLQPFNSICISTQEFVRNKVFTDSLSIPIRQCTESGFDTYVNVACLLGVGKRTHMVRLGQETPSSIWVCPTDTEHEKSVLRILRKVTVENVKGILLSALYYPEYDYCFCGNCRKLAKNDGLDLEEIENKLHGTTSFVDWMIWKEKTLDKWFLEALTTIQDINKNTKVLVEILWDGNSGTRLFHGQNHESWSRAANLVPAFYVFHDGFPVLEKQRIGLYGSLFYSYNGQKFYHYVHMSNNWHDELREAVHITNASGAIVVAITPDLMKRIAY